MFALIVTTKGAKNSVGVDVSYDGERFWVVNDDDGWVDASTSRYTLSPPRNVRCFESKEGAELFAAQWTGHPWWIIPDTYDIVELGYIYETVVKGYRIINETK